MTTRINKKDFLKSFVLYLMLFQPMFVKNTQGVISLLFSYVDEFVTVAFACFALSRCVRGFKFNRTEIKLIAYIVLILFSGFISSAINRCQQLLPIVVDAFTCSKFMICLLGIEMLGFDSNFFYRRNRMLRIIVDILFILDAINIFLVRLFPVAGVRFLIPAQKLMFKHPVDMADFLLIVMLILTYNSKIKRNEPTMLLISAMIVTTQRFKQMAVLAIIWLLYIYIAKGKMKSKLPLGILMVLVAFLIGGDMFGAYYSDTSSARFLLTKVSIEIATVKFPLGLGFASFGSSMSEKYYSQAYIQYGLNNIWGLGLYGNTSFISDTFWPTVLGQMGICGLVVIICFFVFMLKRTLLIYHDSYKFVVSAVVLAYLLITSLGASAIFGPYAPLFACIYGMVTFKERRKS